jgi:hypothetical protein
MFTGIEGNGGTYIPGASTLENIQSRRPIPQLGFVIVGKTLGTNSFNALTITAEKRMSHGLSFLAGFRWAKSLDEASQSDFDEDVNSPYNIRASRGLSDYDIKRQFTLSYVWQPAVPEAFGPVGRQIFGNWRLNGILSIRTGFPYSIYSGVDNALIGAEVNLERGDLTGQSPSLPGGRSESQKLNEWFNTAAFTYNAIGTFGNSARNFLRGPGLANMDFALVRSFPISKGPFKETQRLDFRAEFFNIFNRPNFQNPDFTITDGPLFGAVLGALDPRILQFALKFLF